MNILILGYYDRHNIGDDYYKTMFSHILHKHKLTIINTDDIDKVPKKTDLIICGGGDMMNSYFIDNVNKIVKNSNYKGPVYAISVGLPYPSFIKEGGLDIFDFITVRHKTDHNLLLERFDAEHVKYMPDLVNYIGLIDEEKIKKKHNKEIKKIAICHC